jgi:hypothetical protein
MKAMALSALVLLLWAGAVRADPPGVAGRIEKAGGRVGRLGDGPGGPAVVVWMPRGTTDADLAPLCELRGLRALSLEDPRITDAGVARVAGLPGLTMLSLEGTAVTDAGLKLPNSPSWSTE